VNASTGLRSPCRSCITVRPLMPTSARPGNSMSVAEGGLARQLRERGVVQRRRSRWVGKLPGSLNRRRASVGLLLQLRCPGASGSLRGVTPAAPSGTADEQCGPDPQGHAQDQTANGNRPGALHGHREIGGMSSGARSWRGLLLRAWC